jgi:DNA invertase Pin-like site-specific DNA recombinase
MEKEITLPVISYCLYARKSTESDERQTMSIDSQIKEMQLIAQREGIIIKEIRLESHSAKQSGQRPVFNQLLFDIQDGVFEGILTWAPDRLSRNAGDLGRLVDLMDQGKLHQIKTYSQTFSNNPNEKFLLMILCSQAKLENDNRGINVKRGMRAKCEMGWRPGLPPIGYHNRMMNGIHDILIDPERAPYVKEMFERVAYHKQSGRVIKRWLDKSGHRTRLGKKLTLSQIYIMLRNTFYYGEFEYPAESGKWYTGKHESLISKELFDLTQKQIVSPRKAKWATKGFAFTRLFTCAGCGSLITAEEKFKNLVNGSCNRHVYYHCTRMIKYDCTQPYINEKELIKEIRDFIEQLPEEKLMVSEKLQGAFVDYQRFTRELYRLQNLEGQPATDMKSYARFVLREGSNREKAELVRGLHMKLCLDSGKICNFRNV